MTNSPMLRGGLVSALCAREHDLSRVARVDVVLQVRPERGRVRAELALERLYGHVHRLLVFADVAVLYGAVLALLALVHLGYGMRHRHVVHEVDTQRELERVDMSV